MKNIYIMDEYQSSQRNGLGVFVKHLIAKLKSDSRLITHIDVNTNKEAFTIEENEGIIRFCFPKFSDHPFTLGAKILTTFFRLYIQDSPDNIFILNHSPCEKLILALKESYPLSKIVFIIHDFFWTFRMVGNVNEFREFIGNRNEADEEEKKTKFGRFDEEVRIYQLVDKLICLSNDSYNLLQEIYGVDKNKIALISNGLADTFTSMSTEKKLALRKERYINKDEKILIYVGRINKIKGGTALLASFCEILKTNPNCRLVIIGQLIDLNDILDQGKNISSRVTYTGYISKSEIADWYQIADIGLIPSYIEQCSYSAMEMMMYGLPIIASDGFSVRCMFQDGVNAKVAKIGNRKNEEPYIKNLAEAILRVLSSDELQLQLKKGSRTIFETKYEVSYMLKKYIELIELL